MLNCPVDSERKARPAADAVRRHEVAVEKLPAVNQELQTSGSSASILTFAGTLRHPPLPVGGFKAGSTPPYTTPVPSK